MYEVLVVAEHNQPAPADNGSVVNCLRSPHRSCQGKRGEGTKLYIFNMFLALQLAEVVVLQKQNYVVH